MTVVLKPADDKEVAEYMTDYLWNQVTKMGLDNTIEGYVDMSAIKENMTKEHILVVQNLRRGGYHIQKVGNKEDE